MTTQGLRTFIAYVEDLPGVLNRVTSLFRRRGYNIVSLTVGTTHEEGVSRMTITTHATDDEAARVEANIYKLVNVLRVDDTAHVSTVARELALVKVKADTATRPQVMQICEVFRARVVDIGTSALICEITGTGDKIDSLVEVLMPFGILETVRTGSVAMLRSAEASDEEAQKPRDRPQDAALGPHPRPLPKGEGSSTTLFQITPRSTPLSLWGEGLGVRFQRRNHVMAKISYDKDADLGLVRAKKVAIIGYGSQGHAHALNLKESGVDVAVGLPETSKSLPKAKAAGLAVKPVAEAAAWADVIMMLVPDTSQAAVYEQSIAPGLAPGKTLMFAHGFNIRFGTIKPRPDIDVSMIAPKGPGHRVRETYQAGGGVPALLAVHADPSGSARAFALSYAAGIGATRAGVLETTFAEETETDLFGEQAVLCGGVSALVKAGFSTLVEAGYQPEVAYFECLHELKLIVDLMYRGGLDYMRYSISDTAEFGDYASGPRVVDERTKETMRQILAEIRSGQFANRWIEETAAGRPWFEAQRKQERDQPIEKVGRELRKMMPFLDPIEKAPGELGETAMDPDHVRIFDTTLRDGEQSPGAAMTSAQKLDVARALARLGVDVIESGFPAASPDDLAAVQAIARAVGQAPVAGRSTSQPPIICALARAAKADIDAAWAGVREAARPRIHTFLATSDVHLEHKLRMTRAEVLSRVEEMVSYARSLCPDVEFSPEDAGRSDPAFLHEVLGVAIRAGATTLNIPDTVGYTMPDEFGALIAGIMNGVPGIEKVIVSVHCHDDLGLATANTLAGLRAGARQAEVTINGIGERAGNTPLEELVMTLHTRAALLGLRTGVDTTQLTRTSRLVSTVTGFAVPPNKAIVGSNAFAHESGIHQHGMMRHAETYEIMRPETVGAIGTQLVLGKHSGRAALGARLAELGMPLDQAALDRVFTRFKALADRRKQVTSADLEALAADDAPEVTDAFALDAMQVSAGTMGMPTATVRLRCPDGRVRVEAAIGTGPVDAAFKAASLIVGVRIALVEYAVHAVTEGIDALGEVTVRVREETTPGSDAAPGRVLHGYGADADILVASVKAYLRAVNRLFAVDQARTSAWRSPSDAPSPMHTSS